MSEPYRVDERETLSPEEFAQAYVRRAQPVVWRGALADCPAAAAWSFDYLRRRAGDFEAPLKDWTGPGIRVTRMRLSDYLDSLERFEASPDACERPAYLHDIPLTRVFRHAAEELRPFPREFFSPWYRADWTLFAQMFLGPSASVTPLHFDCLLTHNLFFQIFGRKRFTLLPPEELSRCYPHHWRWCAVDAEAPDDHRFPLFREARRAEVVVGPTDLLYMPPGTLHHVRSLDCALSFNVDWHTRKSVAKGLLAGARGMPAKNVYYNLLVALGLWAKAPMNRVLPYYRSYLDYVS
jgi:hypothetical protein